MTLTQLKRDADSGRLSLELIERFGSTEIIERLKGIRKVKKSFYRGIICINQNGMESEIRIDSANLFEYDRHTLTVYNPGTRALNEEEKRILTKANEIREKSKDTYSGGFWQVKEMIRKSPCPYLSGYETIKGKRYDISRGVIYDNQIKGEPILKYRVYYKE